jgi:hypothetical protein
MLKQALSTVVAVSALVAGIANAGETNPLHPSYATFAATIDFGASRIGNSAAVDVAKNPLTPSYYQWNVATKADGSDVQIVMNNPLQPNYKRS